MKTVSNILRVKGDAVWSTTSTTSVYEALGKMAAKNVGALVVMDDTELVGVFSERAAGDRELRQRRPRRRDARQGRETPTRSLRSFRRGSVGR